jgi:hypothetical protein
MTEAASSNPNANLQPILSDSEHHLGKLAAGIVVNTTGRFSLAPQGLSSEVVRDVIASMVPKEVGYRRFLIVEAAATDSEIYELMERDGIPQLPRLKVSDQTPDGKIIFGVRDGLKPLINEALFSRPSSPTYIGDKEIYHQLGRLYRRAWEATGKILLDPHNPQDSPMRHVAIHSFADSNDILTLCPPYSPDTPTLEQQAAFKQFTTSMQDELATHIEQPINFDQTQYLDELLWEARVGFKES